VKSFFDNVLMLVMRTGCASHFIKQKYDNNDDNNDAFLHLLIGHFAHPCERARGMTVNARASGVVHNVGMYTGMHHVQCTIFAKNALLVIYTSFVCCTIL